MTKRILSTCALALLFCSCAGPANAAFYVRPEVQFGYLPSNHFGLGVGGALAWGGAFGREQRFEVGVEFSKIRYEGGELEYRDRDERGVLVTKKISSKCAVTPIQAAFRYTFVTDDKKVRPYIGLSLGHCPVDFDLPNKTIMGNSGGLLIGSLGGGVSYQLDPWSSVNFGYRYFFSNAFGSDNSNNYPGLAQFRYNAHVFSIAVNLRFGGE